MKYSKEEVMQYVREEDVKFAPFTVITPDSKNPYKQMYVAN